jgi:hypothetical protein
MGSESFFPIGTRLTHIETKEVLIVTGGGDQLVVSPAEFGPPRALGIVEARQDYTAEIPEGAVVDTPEQQRAKLTPEQIFAKAAAEAAAAGVEPTGHRGRRKSQGDAEPRRQGGE